MLVRDNEKYLKDLVELDLLFIDQKKDTQVPDIILNIDC